MEKIMEKNGTIIFSIDSFSVVFSNSSIGDVLNAMRLKDHLWPGYEEIIHSWFSQMMSYGAVKSFAVHKLVFEVKAEDAFKLCGDDINDVSFFDVKLPYIRLSAQGEACDNLRSLGVNVEQLCFNKLDLPLDCVYHFTRCDFAFDLLDYKPRLIEDLIDCANQYGKWDFSGCHVIVGQSRPLTFSARTGDQKTVYIGKGGSNKCLRVYDKKMQSEQRGIYNSENFKHYNSLQYMPESWIRMELQLRREKITHDVLSIADAQGIFKWIFEEFAIRAGEGNNKPVTDLWLNLFDWEKIPLIIQNANYIEEYHDFLGQAESYLAGVAISSMALFAAHHGTSCLIKMINDWLDIIQRNPDLQYKFRRFRYRAYGGLSEPTHLVKNTEGIYFVE